ncbi:MAG TPA: CHAP domain-containing protein [Chloroflexia bacterium]|nr:CHAP domain-containing protein [Chloroflexia bacterium]
MKLALDNVRLEIEAPVLRDMEFVAAKPGDANQIATASELQPFREVSIIAMPEGSKPPAEAVPMSAYGNIESIHSQLDAMREMDRGVDVLEVAPGYTDVSPSAILFGQTVRGHATLQRAMLTDEVFTPVLVVEWAADAGPRTWIVRVSQELPPEVDSLAAAQSYLSAVEGLTLDSTDPGVETSLVPDTERSAPPLESVELEAVAVGATPDVLPPPPWWSDPVCDRRYYTPPRAPETSRPLGGSYIGVLACGPKPSNRAIYDVRAFMKPGDFGILEWECVELSIRFMYMAYGIPQLPFGTNGSDVVKEYAKSTQGQKLELIANGTRGTYPRPGDILSYGQPGTVGHTAVCIESNVDANGNGTIKVLEENNSNGGIASHTVRKWRVEAFMTIFNYLHKPLPAGIQDNGSHLLSTVTNPANTISGGFKQLWEKPHLGLFVCGYPITSEMAENNLTVQYFENVRMEWQPGTQPRFGPVGTEYVQLAGIENGNEPGGPGSENFSSGHSVGGRFLELYKRLGPGVCGLPITGEIAEPQNGLTVQYFQNVRMERAQSGPARFGAVARLLRDFR